MPRPARAARGTFGGERGSIALPIRWEIQGRLLLFTAEGDYHLSDVRLALDAAIASPEFHAPMCLFADARESTANPSAIEVRETAAYLGRIRDQFLPSWFLVVRGSLRYGLARMLGVFAEQYGIDLQVHRDVEEGRRAAEELAA